MGEGGGGEEKALSFFRFYLSPFPQKRLILRLLDKPPNMPKNEDLTLQEFY